MSMSIPDIIIIAIGIVFMILPIIFFIGLCYCLLFGFLYFFRKDILKENAKRFIHVLFASTLISIICGMSAATTMTYSLPSNDQAHHLGGLILFDPFVLIPVSVVSITLGSLLSVFYYSCTISKNLFRSSIFVALVGIVVTSSVSFIWNIFIAVIVGLIGVICSLIWIKYSTNDFINNHRVP